MDLKEKAKELFAQALKDRAKGDLESALKNFSMSLSYDGQAEVCLERAKTGLEVWLLDNDERTLWTIESDLKRAGELDKQGIFRKSIEQLNEQLKTTIAETSQKLEDERTRTVSIEDVFDFFCQNSGANRWFDLTACGDGGEPSEEETSRFEEQIGFRLPDDFREFTMSSLGGLYLVVKEELWPPAQVGEVGPFWTFLNGIKVFGISTGVPEWLDLRAQFNELQKLGAEYEFDVDGFVPFLQLEGDADMYCFQKDGHIVKWYHDDPESPEVLEIQTFSKLFMTEIRELERRKERKLLEKSR